MARTKDAPKKTTIYIEGRMINGSLWDRDKYDENSAAKYKVEVAISQKEKERVEELLADYCDSRFGPGGGDDLFDGEIISPLIDGNKLAKKREKKGKKGDAYKDKWVIRADTQFNHEGNDAAGGLAVFDEDAEQIFIIDQEARREIYNGMLVKVAVTVGDYENEKEAKDALKFYLSAVQKIGDGEKLTAAPSYDQFKPTGRRSSRGDDEDEAPRRSRRTRSDEEDEEEEEAPRKRRGRSRDEEDEEEEEAPRKRRASRDRDEEEEEDEDEEEAPRKRRSRRER